MFIPIQNVLAIGVDLSTIPACDGGPAEDGQICTIDGELTNPTFSSGETTNPCEEVTVEVTDPVTGRVRQETRFECVNSQTHNRNEWFTWGKTEAKRYDMSGLVSMFEGARLPLTPQAIWDETKRNTNRQHKWFWSLRCDYKKQNDDPRQLVRQELSDEKMTLGPYYDEGNALENGEFYQTAWTPAKKTGQNYQKAIEHISANVFPCGFETPATPTNPGISETQGRGIWELLQIIFQTIFRDPEARNISESTFTETHRSPHNENISGVLIQADDKVFEFSRSGKEREAAIRANPGVVETFRPCGQKFEPDDYNGEIVNPYEWGDGTQFTVPSKQTNSNLWEASTNYLQSTLLPVSLQEERHKKQLETKPCGEPTPTPEEGGWNCNTNISEQLSEQANQAGQDWAENSIFAAGSCPTSENAWEMCHNDVVARAKKSCVDPLFALTIWLHETAASNYQCSQQVGGSTVEDFGIHTNPNVEDENFSQQLDAFLALDYECPHTIQDWVSKYYIGNSCYAGEPDKTKVNDYVASLQAIYSQLGGSTLPSWPKGSCGQQAL